MDFADKFLLQTDVFVHRGFIVLGEAQQQEEYINCF